MIIIGCDEVGRGPIAGPVIACAVRIKKTSKIEANLRLIGVTDSKKISQKKRKRILSLFKINTQKTKLNRKYSVSDNGLEFEFCLQSIDHQKIDEINILQASLLAMKKSAQKLIRSNESILIDGNKAFDIKNFEGKINFLIKGDSKSVAIGLASIIAKDFRDELMRRYDLEFPGYGFSTNAGYPTKAHKEAVIKIGVTPIHRRSFKGVKEYC